jgi:hypothetical protein
MALTHQHVTFPDQPPNFAQREWAAVDSQFVGVSTNGQYILWSTGFSGCIGVVMCTQTAGGLLAHLNQMIQNASRDLRLALETVAQLFANKFGQNATDVLIYYGDPGENYGENQGHNLTEQTVKEVMGCTRLIDLRRRGDKEATPWGSDFVYDPFAQIVYTVPAGQALDGVGLDLDNCREKGAKTPFPYPQDIALKNKLYPYCGGKGVFTVP